MYRYRIQHDTADEPNPAVITHTQWRDDPASALYDLTQLAGGITLLPDGDTPGRSLVRGEECVGYAVLVTERNRVFPV